MLEKYKKMPFLKITNLNQKVGKKNILHSLSFTANCGEITAILGPNGAGKTTFLKTVIGLLPTPPMQEATAQNCMYLDNILINSWPSHQRIEFGLSYLPQQSSLFSHMSVKDNLHLIYEYHNTWQHKPLIEFLENRDYWLTHINLLNTINQKAETLSGGQKRKLEIVRTLLMHPKMIMLDEPFAGVDPKSIYELKKIFTELTQKGIGIIISDHHVDQLFSIASRAYVIIQGKVVTFGTIKDILENSHIKENYLGNQFYDEMSERFLK